MLIFSGRSEVLSLFLSPLATLHSFPANTTKISPQIHQGSTPYPFLTKATIHFQLPSTTPATDIHVSLLEWSRPCNPFLWFKNAIVCNTHTPYSASGNHSHSFNYKLRGQGYLCNHHGLSKVRIKSVPLNLSSRTYRV